MESLERVLIGTVGALVGVLGWLFVGIFIQRREYARRARNAGRAVYFELGANHLAIFTALEYGTFEPLVRSTYDRLLPELATWLPPAELQALALAYLGHGGYAEAAENQDLADPARRAAIGALAEAHRIALGLLQRRLFTARELASLDRYASNQHSRLMEVAESAGRGETDG